MKYYSIYINYLLKEIKVMKINYYDIKIQIVIMTYF